MENKYVERYVSFSTYRWEIPDESNGILIKLLTKDATERNYRDSV